MSIFIPGPGKVLPGSTEPIVVDDPDDDAASLRKIMNEYAYDHKIASNSQMPLLSYCMSENDLSIFCKESVYFFHVPCPSANVHDSFALPVLLVGLPPPPLQCDGQKCSKHAIKLSA